MSTVTDQVVDRRIEARRAEVARRDGRRRLSVVAGLTLVATLGVVAVALVNSSLLDVETVEVVGAERAIESHVVTASGVVVGQPLVDVDTEAIARAVEAVPWIDEASVERRWNGQVTIVVTERRGVVALPTGERFTLVDSSGRQLELVEVRPADLVAVTGVEASGVPGQPIGPDAMAVVALVEHLTPTVRTAITDVSVIDGDLVLSLTVGGRAVLGDARRLDDKIVALETILDQVDLSCLATIDVQVPSAPTIRRLEPGGESVGGEEPEGQPSGC